MIVSGGENVYSVEVENAISKHAAVLECAVFGVPDQQWGERVHAAVVLKPDTTATEQEIVAHCREQIAAYKLPRSIDFHTDPLPKSGAGKVLKRELRAPYWGRTRETSLLAARANSAHKPRWFRGSSTSMKRQSALIVTLPIAIVSSSCAGKVVIAAGTSCSGSGSSSRRLLYRAGRFGIGRSGQSFSSSAPYGRVAQCSVGQSP